MDSTVIIVGATGLVGTALLREFRTGYRAIGTFCHNEMPNLVHLDLRDRDEVHLVVSRVRPGVILCPAADANVEFCETDPMATRAVNVDGLQNLLLATREIGATLVYFSTEYVFDGTQGPYSESDSCNPMNEYGRQKLECEQLIAAQLGSYIIGRISGVYDIEKRRKNFVARLIDCVGAGQTFEVPSDQIITPTYAPNLARIVRGLIETEHRGLFHLAGSQALLRSEFASIIASVFGLDASLIVPVLTSQLGLRAARPRSAGLRVDKLKALLDLHVMAPREGLEEMKREFECQLVSG